MSKQDEISNIPLYPEAQLLLQEYSDKFTASLLLQSKLRAYQREDTLVIPNHVKEAREVLRIEEKRKWGRELQLVMGAGLFGAFVPGFITELSNGNSSLVVVYVVLGFAGMFLVFWALRQR